NEMGVIRFERRAISVACIARIPGVRDFSSRRNSEQLKTSAISGKRFTHHRHHARLSAAVNDERAQPGSRGRGSVDKQLCKTTLPRIVEFLRAAEYHDQCMRLSNLQRFQNSLRICIAPRGDDDGLVAVVESNCVSFHDLLLPSCVFSPPRNSMSRTESSSITPSSFATSRFPLSSACLSKRKLPSVVAVSKELVAARITFGSTRFAVAQSSPIQASSRTVARSQ